ncbi:cupin domain-containing protein [Paenibacillus cymbidii]|uniref:cupin domain-containing protein n=1 Tax=Paenibacillus cymbidii TaxID=1639034 RepID=UPI001F2C7D58|nr:cupin domain-containing protein [Paenibacillus cymbidii]
MLRSGEARIQQFEWGTLFWFADKALIGCNSLTLGRTILKPGRRNERHCHTNCDEILYVWKGKLEHSVGDASFVLNEGDTLHIPAGVFHHALNIGDEDADLMMTYSSGERDFVVEHH